MFAGSGMEQMGINMQEMLGQFLPKRTKKRRLPVREARKVLIQEEGQKLIDMDQVTQESIQRAEQIGDHLYRRGGQNRRQGSARRPRCLPGRGAAGHSSHRRGIDGDDQVRPVKTDHILFIAAGAFHIAKPSDLIPELQGRFPIRVELDDLTADDFFRILTEPKGALIKQYTELLRTEGIEVKFTRMPSARSPAWPPR
jgi:ATP-dependent HslUV protease ATP-binding subunit HslU